MKNRILEAHKNNFKISFAIKNNALSLPIEAWGSEGLFPTHFFYLNHDAYILTKFQLQILRASPNSNRNTSKLYYSKSEK